MPGTEAPRWRFLITPRWLAWHLIMVGSVYGMLALGDWQLHRAMSGNGLSWAYTFEWPIFAVFAVVFWAKTIRDEFRIRRGEMPDPRGVLAVPGAHLHDYGKVPRPNRKLGHVTVTAPDPHALAMRMTALTERLDWPA